MEHLPEDMRRRWTYFGLCPNVFFDIYPEWMDFFHVLPLGAARSSGAVPSASRTTAGR